MRSQAPTWASPAGATSADDLGWRGVSRQKAGSGGDALGDPWLADIRRTSRRGPNAIY